MIWTALRFMSYIGGLAAFGSIVIVFLGVAKKFGDQHDDQ